MEEKINGILNRLLSHEIGKSEAVKDIKNAVAVWGGEMECWRINALKASVSALYFSGGRELQNGHIAVVRFLTGNETFEACDVDKLYSELHPE